MGVIMGTVWFPVNDFMNQSVSIGERLRSERLRLGLSQPALGEVAGVTKKTQMLYEAGERFPDAEYLAAIATAGADVLYVVTGQTGGNTLNPEEQTLLAYFRDASKEARRAALGALLGAAGAVGAGGLSQVNQGHGAVQIGSTNAPPPKRRG